MVVADECGDALTEYLEGGDMSAFGADDPWSDLEHGIDTLVDAFASVSINVKDKGLAAPGAARQALLLQKEEEAADHSLY